MKRLLCSVAGGMLWWCLAGFAAASTAASQLGQPEVLEAFVDGMVQATMENHHSPSGSVVVLQHGKVLLAKGYGYQDVEQRIPVDPGRTLFRPGSVSKLLTWVAVMQLVEQGRLDLDADVNNYLETFAIEERFEEPVTLRSLMTHTPGFEDGGMGYLIIDDAARALPLREAMQRYQPERVNPPGRQTAYSNYGAALAGLIVSNVSGKPFADYVEENIFIPLGMHHSTFVEPLPAAMQDAMAVSYAASGGAYQEQPFEIIISFSPAGAMSSTALDMAQFGQAILNGGVAAAAQGGQRILRPESVTAMLSRQFSQDERMMGMALGFYETERNGIRLLGHDGDTAWFHSELVLDQQNGLVYFVTFGGAGGSAVRSTFKNAFYDKFFPRNEPAPLPPADFASHAERYTGTYWFWRSNFSGIEKAFGMADEFQVSATSDNTLLIAIGGDARQYVEVDDNLFRERDPAYSFGGGWKPRLVAFQQNRDGEITGFILDEWPFMSLRKKPFYETMRFTQPAFWLAMLVFALMLVYRLCRRMAVRLLSQPERAAIRAASLAALANLLILALGNWVLGALSASLRNEIPLSFKLALVVPVLATLAGAWLAYQTVRVWQHSLLHGVMARLAYSVVALAALFMCWLYWFWNILGWQWP